MKIGIDVFCSDHGRSGIGSYIHSFVKNLYLIKDNEKYSNIDFKSFSLILLSIALFLFIMFSFNISWFNLEVA